MVGTGDIGIERHGHVVVAELRRPPHNFFDIRLLTELADQFDRLAADPSCRAVVLASQGKAFCAGAQLGEKKNSSAGDVYQQARRLFAFPKPVVVAVQGAAVGGGLGLAMVGDFRCVCPEARFSANFTALGFHPGFGLTETLPRVIGRQHASLMFLTSRRVKGEEAHAMGLADVLVQQPDLRGAALGLAGEIAAQAPLGVVETRATLRLGLEEAIDQALKRELEIQLRLRETQDFAEGVAAVGDRRVPEFRGQ
ncbi:MAG: enoyl-CoA hydratase/isomerase family protein [Alphaproteobacteria bacterium]|jgi:enoyl-CoA hydratase/carnithine racemase|nr:enoyl-CoA hydratase/isomerase family protein [Rhodospirillaceae bacterium]MDG2483337.1 enoyl-CoA hydratase/isomerase family protein [Alphaproteobacteria bacterium]MBT6206370.1 enoyl-CoA hydratase/isomerase family protein [Rhodospirillaceae bacterium]MBT6508978.1 enoyl-CoA hydratase/isomerase family protein [Rhodospirillaceae bacterium]MBT7614499.1 enoyl-CoA hydratase/isomerase family protein [Rhodospirillaceae bacterium]